MNMRVTVQPSRRDGHAKVVFDGDLETDSFSKSTGGVRLSITLNSIYDTSKYRYCFDFSEEEVQALMANLS
jgi:hypothetical protein